MSALTPISSCRLRRAIVAPATLALALSAPISLNAAIIQATNVTEVLGPTFFIDDAANGGTDTDINQPGTAVLERSFTGLLARNQGPARVTLTGFGFATHTSATANDATSVSVAFTYLGADEALGGGDDVVIGNTTGSFTFVDPLVNTNAEYALAFNTPLSSDLAITGTRFRIVVTPSNPTTNGSLKLKAVAPAYSPATGPKVSVAGVVAPVINPNRVNLAKFQAVSATSSAGQRLATYLNDGVAGNDNRWQGSNSTWQWIRVDFPFPVEVGSAHVFTGVDDGLAITNYGLQFWNGTTWSNIPGGSVTGNTNVERNLVFSNAVTAASFRFMSAESSLRVRELAFFPTNGPAGFPLGTDVTVNLAHQRPVLASTNSAGNFPLYAVDGRATSFSWQTTTAGTNTLDLDLRVTTKIGSVHLYSGSAGVAPLADFTLKYWDGASWVNIPGGTITANAAADRVVTFSMPVTTSMVRLEFNNPGTTSIREICVFPANSGNVGYPLGTNINPSGRIAKQEDFNDSFYRVSNPSSGRFAAVTSGNPPALDQAGATTAQGQYQVLLNHSTGTYRLRNRDTGNCLSGAQLSKTPGQPLTDAPYTALPHQDWILIPLGGGTYQLINQWSGLAVDTQGGATAQGTALVQNTPGNATTQRWQFTNKVGYPKKGIGGTSASNLFKANWVYNWGQRFTESLASGTIFMPMQWGDFNWVIGSNAGPLWQYYPNWRDASEAIHLLGFNEPDRTDQSNMTLGKTIEFWPRLLELDLPLVSPAPADPAWLDAFYVEANRLGYRVDYTAIHLYPGPSSGSSNGLIGSVLDAYADGGNRPVWLTEFSFVDWGGNQSWSEEDNYNALAEFIWRAESVPELRKYALFVFTEDAEYPQPANPWQSFTPAPRSNSRDKFGNLTAFGKLYTAWDNDATVRTDKTYHLHNKGTRKRMANLTSQTNVAGRDIRTDGDLVHWTLVSAGGSNLYYLVSSLDGRRLSTTATSGAAGTVSLVAAGTTGTAVQWSLTQSTHGWYYLVHPASTRRLQLAFNNSTQSATYTMAASSTVADAVQWRFIVPATTAGNTGPTLASNPSQAVNEGVRLNFTASATDADLPPATLFYSLVNAPTGASINPTSGVFSWTPAENQGPGTFNFSVRVSDGYLTADQPVSVTVSEVNVAPVLEAITSPTVNEGSPVTFTATATDADLPANTLTYSLVGAPAGAAINSANGNFTWTPSEAQGPGTFNFSVRVSDGSLTHQLPVSITVNEVNTAPALASIPGQTVDEGVLLNFTASATDADLPANTLTYALLGAPGGATINASSGAFSWTPNETQGPGTFNFTVRVSDGSLFTDRSVAVTANEVNTAPTLAAVAAQTVDEGVQLTFTASATDADLPANALTYGLIGAPTGAAINPATGVFTWTADEEQGPGTFNFTVRVSDGNLTADRSATVTVNEVNSAPVLAGIPPQTVDEGVVLNFAASAADPDLPANPLSFSLLNAPSGASIDPGTGAFTWTPTEEQGPGTFNFAVRVSDGSVFRDQPVAATVNEVNVAPVLEPIPPQSVNTDALLTFTATAADADLPANALTYTLVGAPDGAAIDSSTGVFTWTPAEAQGPGTYNFTAQVSDGILTHDQPVSVTVASLAPSPHETDTDGDGLSDFMEYAFGTNPGTPNQSPFRVVSANGAGTITLQLQWNWQAAGLSWQIRHGRELANVPAWPIVAPGATTVVRDGGIDHITISPAKAVPEGGFYILEVIEN